MTMKEKGDDEEHFGLAAFLGAPNCIFKGSTALAFQLDEGNKSKGNGHEATNMFACLSVPVTSIYSICLQGL
jgi:hypothetical protein